MEKELKVLEFDRKQDLLDYVNTKSKEIDILSISSTQVAYTFKHFLWYYEK